MSNAVMETPESTESGLAERYFICNTDYGVIICRQCCEGVRYRDIVNHLTQKNGTHRLTKRLAKQVEQVIHTAPEWNAVSETPIVPQTVVGPIPGLTMYEDGVQCLLRDGGTATDDGSAVNDGLVCGAIYRSKESMRVHWSKKHQWSATSRPGKATAV
ncbi:hypothetical protein N7535_005000 [Penicillium sp. DV-2018c]|nr:hypothetical protein N7461_008581 [Penicillium sp. DV-2018c]KAJ5571340.1 hypothetical protein N7535_005000 [Penicillium sp. DV-2018c]